MGTWTLLDPPRVNREGNQIELDLYVSGLAGGLDPTLLRSRVNTLDGSSAKTMVSLAGWRTNYSTLAQYYEDPLALPAEVELASGTIVSIDQSGSDASVSISLRLRQTAQVSCGADFRPVTRGLFVSQLLAELVVLQEIGGGPVEESTTFTYDAGTDLPTAMNLTIYAASVGKLPGWASGTGVPVLLLHCDAFAERAARYASGSTVTSTPIDSWTDLRLSGASDLVQATGSRQPQLSAAPNAAPTIAFDDDFFERSESVDLVQDDCAFGAVFNSVGNIIGVRHLIGRWSGGNVAGWQWRLVYERVSGSPDIHKVRAEFVSSGGSPTIESLETTIDEPTENTIVIYRVNNAGTPTGELWVNGVLAATTTTLLSATNTSATQILTVGARYVVPPPGPGASTDDYHHGAIDQCFAYSTTISDAALSAIHHELARRAGVELGPIPQSNLTQPYTDANPEPDRRLDRWPVAMINLYGGVYYDDNVLSQNPNWRNGGNRQDIVDWFTTRIRRILTASADFDILINRPQGGYRNDIIAAGIFGDTDNTFVPVIEDYQWEALTGWTDMSGTHEGVFEKFALLDRNYRDGRQGPDVGFARRCWFYTGNITINDDGEATQDARVGVRNMSPCSADFYKEHYLDPWADKDTRFRCFFVDSASKWDRKWVEIVQDSAVNEAFTIVGEAITTDANARKGAVWFSMIGIRTAPWWTNFDKTDGYNWSWSAGKWDQTPIYVGIAATGNRGDLSLDSPSGVGEQDSLRLEDAYRFVNAGVAPIAWGGDYQKIATAWYYGARRIPVGRYPMMSPRISRIWR